MNTSETSTLSFEDKLKVLSEFRLEYISNDELPFRSMFSAFFMEFSLVTILRAGWAVAEPAGIAKIEALWDFMLSKILDEPTNNAVLITSLEDLIYWSKEGLFSKDDVWWATRNYNFIPNEEA